MAQLHATAVAINGIGVLLTGPSGSGKSDLALRLIRQDARLIADDRSEVLASDEGLNVAPPPTLEGMLEVRGLGIVVVPFEKSAPVGLICELRNLEDIDRLPEVETTIIEGVRLPLYKLAPFEASAPEKIRIAVQLVTGEIGSVA